MKVSFVEWDEGNLAHLEGDNADREISPEDVEEVLYALPNPSRAFRQNYQDEEQIVFYGQTHNGRCLVVIAESFGDEAVRPITAYDMPDDLRHRYLSWRRTVRR